MEINLQHLKNIVDKKIVLYKKLNQSKLDTLYNKIVKDNKSETEDFIIKKELVLKILDSLQINKTIVTLFLKLQKMNVDYLSFNHKKDFNKNIRKLLKQKKYFNIKVFKSGGYGKTFICNNKKILCKVQQVGAYYSKTTFSNIEKFVLRQLREYKTGKKVAQKSIGPTIYKIFFVWNERENILYSIISMKYITILN